MTSNMKVHATLARLFAPLWDYILFCVENCCMIGPNRSSPQTGVVGLLPYILFIGDVGLAVL